MIQEVADAISVRTAGARSLALLRRLDRPGAFQVDRTGVAGEAARAGDTRTAPGAPAATLQRRCAHILA